MHLRTSRTRAARWGAVFFFALTGLSAGCGGDTSAPSEPEPPAPTPTAPEPDHLAFIAQPSAVPLGATFPEPFRIEVRDSTDTRVVAATSPVTVTLVAGPDSATLHGRRSVAAVDGVVTISDLWIDHRGTYQLRATAAGLDADVSDDFEVEYLFRDLVASSTHTCGITTGDLLVCWGIGAPRPAGSGIDNAQPVVVTEAIGYDTVVVGGKVTCDLLAGAARCRGGNTFGQLGSGQIGGASEVPVPVVGGHVFESLTEGSSHVCGLEADGEAWCWGRAMGNLAGSNTDSAEPVLVPGDLSFVRIDAGGDRTCGITVPGDGYCWGLAPLGNGDQINPSWTPSPISGNHSWQATEIGGVHACGLDASGAAWCWGEDNYGDLGTGTPSTYEPGPVVGVHTFRSISAGSMHTCAVDKDDVGWCWGRNELGELGIGDTLIYKSDTPVEVPGLRFRKLLAASEFTCGLTVVGEAWCWGDNHAGNVGDGVPSGFLETVIPSPIRVVDPVFP